ncbi:HD domain-containing protein [Patescibacteria group bacterium]
MIYRDHIYGETEIIEPVILDLINCRSMQRLKGIDQHGYYQPYFPHVDKVTRFDHSLGVFCLLQKFEAELDEQIAGLIHDVSHSAFSHCIDYALGDSGARQDHQDNIFEQYLEQSEIPQIIKQHGFSLNHIKDETQFPLLETTLPDLCADRIDYFLRDAVASHEVTKDQARNFLDKFKIVENKWVLSDYQTAKQYAELFTKMNQTYWSGFTTATMHLAVGQCLGYALRQSYITLVDLYQTDQVVLDKIKERLSDDDCLVRLFKQMNNQVPVTNSQDQGLHVANKSRVVDPLCLSDGSIHHVSQINPDWAKVVIEEKKPKEYCLVFEK